MHAIAHHHMAHRMHHRVIIEQSTAEIMGPPSRTTLKNASAATSVAIMPAVRPVRWRWWRRQREQPGASPPYCPPGCHWCMSSSGARAMHWCTPRVRVRAYWALSLSAFRSEQGARGMRQAQLFRGGPAVWGDARRSSTVDRVADQKKFGAVGAFGRSDHTRCTGFDGCTLHSNTAPTGGRGGNGGGGANAMGS